MVFIQSSKEKRHEIGQSTTFLSRSFYCQLQLPTLNFKPSTFTPLFKPKFPYIIIMNLLQNGAFIQYQNSRIGPYYGF